MFLNTIIKDLYERHGSEMHRVTLILPNKRAGLFLSQKLSTLTSQPIWAPQYTTINDLFHQLSPLTPADPILLVSLVYRSYLEVTGRTSDEETLDHFYSWGEMMVNDFDDLDANLCNAALVFQNLEDLDRLTTNEYLSPEQIEAIKQFFANFDPEYKTLLKEKFLSIWNVLNPTYEHFRQSLREQGYAYEGMIKRDVADGLDTETLSLPDRIYAVIGFNVLSASEKKLFSHLKSHHTTYFYWDYDASYLKDSTEAGRFIRQNIQQFGSTLSADTPCYHQMEQPKEITYIGASTDSIQARYAGQWIDRHVRPDETLNRTAVVLNDEHLLQSVLHSVSPSYALNVTMGFPLQQTPVASLIEALLTLQSEGCDAQRDTWRFKHVYALLQHPVIARLASAEATSLANSLQRNSILFPCTLQLSVNDFLKQVFTPSCATPHTLLRYLADILQTIGKSYANELHTAHSPTDADTALAIESIFSAYTMVNRLLAISEQGLLTINLHTLRRLLRQMVASRSIPFHGEPATGLQIMGTLETRCLDFDNLIMLSTGEGILPARSPQASFIPYSLRKAYGLTTIEKKTALSAYYFHRLIARARRITLLYSTATEGTTRGEMSRFMMQLLTETNLPIRRQSLTASCHILPAPPLSVAKDEAVMARLRQNFDARLSVGKDGQSRYLSPSALNTYINCPLKFYLHYVARLRPADELEEVVGNDIFGNIFHRSMETIYTETLPLGKPIQAPDLLTLASAKSPMVPRIVDRAFNQEFFHAPKDQWDRPRPYNGEQQLNREVIIAYVRSQLMLDAQLCPLTILGVEDKSHSLQLTTADGTTTLTLGGIIDRMDIITLPDGTTATRIVDYKTSQSPQQAKSIEQLFQPSDKRPYHIFQAFYYADILCHEHHWKGRSIAPALAYVKTARTTTHQLAEGNAEALKALMVHIGTPAKGEAISDFATTCQQEYHERLTHLINEIFSPETPFRQCAETHVCQWCDFRTLCKR